MNAEYYDRVHRRGGHLHVEGEDIVNNTFFNQNPSPAARPSTKKSEKPFGKIESSRSKTSSKRRGNPSSKMSDIDNEALADVFSPLDQ